MDFDKCFELLKNLFGADVLQTVRRLESASIEAWLVRAVCSFNHHAAWVSRTKPLCALRPKNTESGQAHCRCKVAGTGVISYKCLAGFHG